MSDWPKSIKLGHLDYELVFDGELQRERLYADASHYPTRRIRLDVALEGQDRRGSLLHEVIHALDAMWKLGISEANTKRLANGLIAFLLDNRELVKLMLQEE